MRSKSEVCWLIKVINPLEIMGKLSHNSCPGQKKTMRLLFKLHAGLLLVNGL